MSEGNRLSPEAYKAAAETYLPIMPMPYKDLAPQMAQYFTALQALQRAALLDVGEITGYPGFLAAKTETPPPPPPPKQEPTAKDRSLVGAIARMNASRQSDGKPFFFIQPLE